ncbi:hypothetical protein ACFQ1S_10470 [Kibdelosporangium lantanae]|uniref:Uncharacterized protein n=1 Tax=Kibdelosporangium lantanae TaxID=1497396 RepID=A0ABW3M8S7_9PSEU
MISIELRDRGQLPLLDPRGIENEPQIRMPVHTQFKFFGHRFRNDD